MTKLEHIHDELILIREYINTLLHHIREQMFEDELSEDSVPDSLSWMETIFF